VGQHEIQTTTRVMTAVLYIKGDVKWIRI